MGNTLYLECYSGISGDMTAAALLDLGASEEVLRHVLSTIPVDGYRINISRAKMNSLDFDVVLDEDNHDHDMNYLYGHTHSEHLEMHDHHDHEHHDHHHEPDHEHVHDEHGHLDHIHDEHKNYDHVHDLCEHAEHELHEHEHPDHHHEHDHHHVHRGINEIIQILEQTQMTDRARDIAERIFKILARAEAKAHGVPEEEVKFHEVGAVDSIVDIVSVAVCLDNLDITECIVPTMCDGWGSIRCQHGILPVPVPAVVNIVEQNNLSLTLTSVFGELVTPTGAAIVASIRTGDKLPEKFRILKTGMGAGKRHYENAGLLRAMIIEPSAE